MERLTKVAHPASPAEARLAELVSAAEPLTTFEAQKRRTLDAILAGRHERRSSSPFALRFALAAGILLAAGAATAAFGVRHWRAETPPSAPAVALAPVVHHAAPRPVAVAQAVVTPEPAPAPEAPSLRARPHRTEDPARVVAALRALRQDHDPARASRLLAGYLHAYPHGALAEEATALSIEAADARHSPAAVAFAERYLRDYPNGRFQQTAARVLARAEP